MFLKSACRSRDAGGWEWLWLDAEIIIHYWRQTSCFCTRKIGILLERRPSGFRRTGNLRGGPFEKERFGLSGTKHHFEKQHISLFEKNDALT
jgi:hypothetical protein